MLGKISPPRVMYGLHTLGPVGNQQPQYPPILRDQGRAAGDENQPCPVQIENCITLRGAAPEVKHIPSHPLLVWTWIQTFTLTEISSACLLLYCFIVLREVAVNLYSIYKLRWEKYFGPICWIVCGWRLVSKFKTGLDSNRTTKLIFRKSQKICMLIVLYKASLAYHQLDVTIGHNMLSINDIPPVSGSAGILSIVIPPRWIEAAAQYGIHSIHKHKIFSWKSIFGQWYA